ncbi:PIN domain nuclease [bacterium]|jgi:hypothetical protein|nr:PIN domain nuclease [Balneola sp.]MBR9918742.1 PIN domain nuclease [bacterium]
MILADSSIWIDFFNDTNNEKVDALVEYLSRERVISADLVITEVLQGFRKDSDFLTAVEIFKTIPCHSVAGIEIALKSAENFRSLRKKGITIRKTVDMILATYCIENNISLLQNDRDFEMIASELDLILL